MRNIINPAGLEKRREQGGSRGAVNNCSETRQRLLAIFLVMIGREAAAIGRVIESCTKSPEKRDAEG